MGDDDQDDDDDDDVMDWTPPSSDSDDAAAAAAAVWVDATVGPPHVHRMPDRDTEAYMWEMFTLTTGALALPRMGALLDSERDMEDMERQRSLWSDEQWQELMWDRPTPPSTGLERRVFGWAVLARRVAHRFRVVYGLVRALVGHGVPTFHDVVQLLEDSVQHARAHGPHVHMPGARAALDTDAHVRTVVGWLYALEIELLPEFTRVWAAVRPRVLATPPSVLRRCGEAARSAPLRDVLQRLDTTLDALMQEYDRLFGEEYEWPANLEHALQEDESAISAPRHELDTAVWRAEPSYASVLGTLDPLGTGTDAE